MRERRKCASKRGRSTLSGARMGKRQLAGSDLMPLPADILPKKLTPRAQRNADQGSASPPATDDGSRLSDPICNRRAERDAVRSRGDGTTRATYPRLGLLATAISACRERNVSQSRDNLAKAEVALDLPNASAELFAQVMSTSAPAARNAPRPTHAAQ